jgi:hypothetical protein
MRLDELFAREILADTRPFNRVVRFVGVKLVIIVPREARSDDVAALILTEQSDSSDETVVLNM